MERRWFKGECTMGIDEAGRGPVLGPMVYGCAYCPSASLQRIASLGFDDSKKLSETQRDELYGVVEKEEEMGWAVDISTAEALSAQMLSREKVSLNVIALESTARLIQGVLDLGANIVEAFVDTVGDPAKYQASLGRRFPSISFTVSKKADSLYPIVSAASVVAKVTRDRELRQWGASKRSAAISELDEASSISANGSQDARHVAAAETECTESTEGADASANVSSGKLFGSGYPGDPETQRWLSDNRDPVFGFSRLVRFSWKTAQAILDDHCVRVHWDEEEQEESTTPEGSAKKRRMRDTAFESCAPQRHSYFKSRQLQHISKGLK